MVDHVQVGGLVLNARDVSAEKRAEFELRKQLTLIDGAAYGCVVFDREGTILFANDALAGMLASTAADIQGCTVRDFITPDLRSRLDETMEEILTKRAIAAWKSISPVSMGRSFQRS